MPLVDDMCRNQVEYTKMKYVSITVEFPDGHV